MKKMKRALSCLLVFALVISSFCGVKPVQAAKKKTAKISSVKITNVSKKLRLQKGKKFRLNTTVKASPNKSKYKKVKFSSSNKKIVLVNSRGLLKGVRTGTAKITATSKTNKKKKASISVTVTKDVLVSRITLNRSSIEADEFNEDDIELKVTKILPSNAKNKKINWSSSNEDVADVDDNGVVTTGDVGDAIITATAADKGGATATCRVYVNENTDQDDDDDDDTPTPAPVIPSNPTPAPQIIPTPVPSTQAPVITEDPEETDTPDETEEPDETAEPDETESPVETIKPIATEKPVITEKPVATKKPVVTEKPAATEKPIVTAKPVVTTKPTVAPSKTTNPIILPTVAPTIVPSVVPTTAPTLVPTPVMTAMPVQTPVTDIDIDLTGVKTTFTSAGNFIDLRTFLPSSINLTMFSNIEIGYTTSFLNDDTSDWGEVKFSVVGEGELDGYSDGFAKKYPSETNGTATITCEEEGVPIGINVQPMNDIYAWPDNLLSITVTSIKFIAKPGQTYPGSTAPMGTPTPDPSAIPEEFSYQGLDTSWIDQNKPMVAFSFNYCPTGASSSAQTAREIQEALHTDGSHATFFYVGGSIEDSGKDDIARADGYGFEIGNQSWNYNSLNHSSSSQIQKSIDDTNKILKSVTGYTNFLFRAPSLAISDTMLNTINAPFINCSVESQDWKDITATQIIENVIKAKDGDIVMFNAANQNTAEAMPTLLAYFREQGIQVVSVSEMYAMHNEKLMTHTKYTNCESNIYTDPSATPSASTVPSVLAKPSVYNMTLSYETEASATKDKEDYRSDVVYASYNGAVAFHTTRDTNSGIVYNIKANGSSMDCSSYGYLRLDVTSPYQISLKGFTNTSSWWNKKELYEKDNFTENRRIIYFKLSDFLKDESSNDFSLSDIRGFGIGTGVGEGSTKEQIIIHSMSLVKDKVQMKSRNESSWSKDGSYGQVTYNDDNTVTFNSQPTEASGAEGNLYNNGCSWYISDDRTAFDASEYKNIAITTTVDTDVKLMTWCSDKDSSIFGDKTDNWICDKTTNEDGSITRVFSVADSFSDPTKAVSVGVTFKSGSDDGFIAQEGVIKSIQFIDPIEGKPISHGDRPDLNFEEGNMLDLAFAYNADLSDEEIAPTQDSDGYNATELKFTENHQRIFFNLPDDVNIADVAGIQIIANVPQQCSVDIFDPSLVKEDSWWNTALVSAYPFYNGSRLDEESPRSIASYTFDTSSISEGKNGALFAIGSNGIPENGFGVEPYLIYGINVIMKKPVYDSSLTSIKSAYAPYIDIMGTETNYYQLSNKQTRDFITHHFNSITMGNETKPDSLMSTTFSTPVYLSDNTDKYVVTEEYKECTANQDDVGNVIVPDIDFFQVDSIMKYAHDNNLKLRFGPFIWHQQTPKHFFKVGYSTSASAEVVDAKTMYTREEMYIRTVMEHILTSEYADVINSIDVAYEYLHSTNTPTAYWNDIFGGIDVNSEYIKKAFVWTYDELVKNHRTNDISLFYSDYNTFDIKDDIIQLINNINTVDDINTVGRICDGVAMQSHIADAADIDKYEDTISAFAAQNYEILISELDITCSSTASSDGDNSALFEEQAENYSKFMNIVLNQMKNGANIRSITLWGLCDDASWRNNYAPLLFGKNTLDKKPAFDSFVDAALNFE